MNLDTSPYYSRYGFKIIELKNEQLRLELPFSDKIIGNPSIKAIHGGLVALTLELAANLQANQSLRGQAYPLNQTTSYLRRTNATSLFASAKLIKPGRRFISMEAVAWQENEAKPVATAVFTFQNQGGPR